MKKQEKTALANINEVDIDLIKDWDQHLNNKMLKMGYKAKKGGYNSLDYHKAIKKLISVRIRKVYYSKEFICPNECKCSLDKLISEVENGKDILPYMSKQIIRPSKNDGLLNDWNIHHFHLSEDYEENTIFVKRSDWLLLAFVNEEGLYCLNVYPHKKPYLWSHINLVEIIDNNWPELIEKNRLKGIVSLSKKLDDGNYSKLRKSNISTFIELGEDKVYGLIGGGYTSDGSSLEAVRTSDYWINYIRDIENLILEEYQSFKKQMLPFDCLSLEKKLEVVLLILTDKDLILLEKERNVIIKVNYNNGKIRMCNLRSLLDEFLEERRSKRPLWVQNI